MDFFGILANAVYAVAGIAFVSGMVITAVTGRAKPVKTFLWALTALFTLLIVLGFIFSQGLLIFLLFQIIALILIWYMFVVIGAVCGGGIYSLRNRRQVGTRMTQAELDDYVPVEEFCALEGIDADRALARIRSGYYRGGAFGKNWYIHKSEQSRPAP